VRNIAIACAKIPDCSRYTSAREEITFGSHSITFVNGNELMLSEYDTFD